MTQAQQAEEFFIHAISDEVKLKEIVCNAFHRLSYQVKAPKNSRVVTGRLADQQRGVVKFSFLFEITAKVQSTENGGSITVSILERNSMTAGGSLAKAKLEDFLKALDEEATDYLQIQAGKEEPSTYGTAKWATEGELIAAGYVADSVDNRRLLLAPWDGTRFLCLPEEATYRHALISGPTGAGKSTGFFIPNICARSQSSFIVTEATAGDEDPQLYKDTAGWRHAQGSEILYFNPDHLHSTRINPMDKVMSAAPEQVPAAAEELCDLIIINTSPPKAQRSDPIWDKSEKWLLWILVMNAVATGDKEECHFGAIRQLLRQDEKVISHKLSNSANAEVAQEFRAFLRHSSENFRHGVFAGLLSRLNPWLTDKIVSLTRTTDFNADELKDKLFTFYLSVPSRKRFLKPVAALIFNYLLDLSLAGGDDHFKYPLALMLDEFTNFGAIPGIDDVLSIIRRRKVGVMLGCQSFDQVESLYGDDIANGMRKNLRTSVIFAPSDDETALRLSKQLGMQTRLREEVSISGDKIEREYGQPLMAPHELLSMAANEIVIKGPAVPPVRTRRFDHVSFPAPVGYSPPERPVHAPIVQPAVSPTQVKAEERFVKSAEAPKPNDDERAFFQSKPDVPPVRKAGTEKEPEQDSEWYEDNWNIP